MGDRVAGTDRRTLLQTEKSTLPEALTAGELSEEALRELTADIDRQLPAPATRSRAAPEP